jgi:hypothetical protein
MQFIQVRLAATTALLLAGTALAVQVLDKILSDLVSEFETAQGAWFEKMEVRIPEEGESAKVNPSPMPVSPVKEFLPRFRALAEARAGTPDSLAPLSWILQNAQFAMPLAPDPGNSMPAALADAIWAVGQLRDHHAESPRIGDLMNMMSYVAWIVGDQAVQELLQEVEKRNSDKSIRAGALFNRATILFEESPFPTPWLGAAVGEPASPSAHTEQAIKLFRVVMADYADTEYAKQASAFIFEAENLQVGMKAPEIAGQDADGKDVRLSQFRGQVVVLDFWGFW